MHQDLPPIATPARRLGVLVPPANPSVEIEFPRLIPDDVAMHVMRLPVLPGDLKDRNRAYVGSYEAALKGFGNLRLDAVSVALTAPQYRLGHQGDVDLCRRLSDVAGIPVETSSHALCSALRALDVEQLTLVSPYPNEITETAKAYWRSAGFAVHDVVSFGDELVAYTVRSDQVVEAIRRARIHPSGVVVLSGTGMRTLEAIAQTASVIGRPVLSSNLCSVWSLVRSMPGPLSPWMQSLLPPVLHPAALAPV